MAAWQGTIHYFQDDERLTFRVEGQATMRQSLSLRRFAEKELGRQGKLLQFDLRHCTHVDSTFVGTLLFLARVARRVDGAELALLSPSAACSEVLRQMGVAEIFQSRQEEEDAALPWNLLTSESAEEDGMRRNILQAHQELAEVPGPAKEAFQAVVRCMSQEIEKDTPLPKNEK